MAEGSEQARFRRANAFDRDAIAAIYDDYYESIYRYTYRQVSDVEIARDLTAEVFRRFLQAIHRGKGPDRHGKAWLFRTAHNAVVDHYRGTKYRQHLPLDEGLIAMNDDPASTVENHLAAERVRHALLNLTPEQHQVIALKFLAELSNQEVAIVIDKPIGAVKSLQHRALASLRRQLDLSKEKA